MKKTLPALLTMLLFSVAMVIGASSLTASATTSGYYTYTKYNGGVIITGVDTSISGDITIPSSLGGYPVANIGSEAFYGCDNITSVIIPDTVTSIGGSAFSFCESLIGVMIPDSVTSIGDSAFSFCESLINITIPDSITTIESFVFYSCDSLTDVWYTGSQTDKGNILIDDWGNDKLTSATWHCDICKTHKYTNACDKKCNKCDWMRTTSHNYTTATTKATLTKNGKIVKKCSVCGSVYSTKTIKYAKTFKLSATSYTYNGKVKTPTVTVKDSAGNKLKKDTDYTIKYASGRKNAGTYKVTVTLKGKYSGKKTLTFKIKKVTSSKVTAKASKNVLAYNGKSQLPTITLKDSNGRTLKKNVDYTVKLPSGRKKVGTYKIRLTLKGNYSGTETVTYTISPTAKKEIKAVVGGTTKIGAKSNQKITYTSSNKKVATVSTKGVIKGIKSGKATITVKSGKIKHKITVRVSKPNVEITAKTKSVYRGKKLQLKATTNPSSAKVTWSVNKKNIATVSSSGVVTGKKYGVVTVTATIKYKGKIYKDTYKVQVKVQEPKITAFVSDDYRITSVPVISISNEGSKSLKVISRGYISNTVNYEQIDSLFMSNGYCSSVTIKSGGEAYIGLTFETGSVWVDDETIYVIYFEYDGELYSAACSSEIYEINKCYSITHYVD